MRITVINLRVSPMDKFKEGFKEGFKSSVSESFAKVKSAWRDLVEAKH